MATATGKVTAPVASGVVGSTPGSQDGASAASARPVAGTLGGGPLINIRTYVDVDLLEHSTMEVFGNGKARLTKDVTPFAGARGANVMRTGDLDHIEAHRIVVPNAPSASALTILRSGVWAPQEEDKLSYYLARGEVVLATPFKKSHPTIQVTGVEGDTFVGINPEDNTEHRVLKTSVSLDFAQTTGTFNRADRSHEIRFAGADGTAAVRVTGEIAVEALPQYEVHIAGLGGGRATLQVTPHVQVKTGMTGLRDVAVDLTTAMPTDDQPVHMGKGAKMRSMVMQESAMMDSSPVESAMGEMTKRVLEHVTMASGEQTMFNTLAGIGRGYQELGADDRLVMDIPAMYIDTAKLGKTVLLGKEMHPARELVLDPATEVRFPGRYVVYESGTQIAALPMGKMTQVDEAMRIPMAKPMMQVSVSSSVMFNKTGETRWMNADDGATDYRGNVHQQHTVTYGMNATALAKNVSTFDHIVSMQMTLPMDMEINMASMRVTVGNGLLPADQVTYDPDTHQLSFKMPLGAMGAAGAQIPVAVACEGTRVEDRFVQPQPEAPAKARSKRGGDDDVAEAPAKRTPPRRYPTGTAG